MAFKEVGIVFDRALLRARRSGTPAFPDVNPPATSCGGYLSKVLIRRTHCSD